jgi:hypothetical protein
MGRKTITQYVDLAKMARQPEEASTVIRLMMVCNDVATARVGLAEAWDEALEIPQHVRWGRKMYMVRLQIGHLAEALPVVAALRASRRLMRIVHALPEQGQNHFHELESCLEGGQRYGLFTSVIVQARNTTSFHYDDKLIRRALRDRAKITTKPQTVTTSNDVAFVRFGLADGILDTLTAISHTGLAKSRFFWHN